jgi:hypothetical protein
MSEIPIFFGGVRVSAATYAGNLLEFQKAEEARARQQRQQRRQLPDKLSAEEVKAIERADIQHAELQAENDRVFQLAIEKSLAVKQPEAHGARPEASAYLGAVLAPPTHPRKFSFGNPTPAEARAEARVHVLRAVEQPQAPHTRPKANETESTPPWSFSFADSTRAEASAQVRPAPQSPNFDCVESAMLRAYDMGVREGTARAAESSAIKDARAAGFDAGKRHAAAACENLIRQVEARFEDLKHELDRLKLELDLLRSSD